MQKRMLRLREMTSGRTLSSKSKDLNMAQSILGPCFHLTSLQLLALVYTGSLSVTRDYVPSRHREVSVKSAVQGKGRDKLANYLMEVCTGQLGWRVPRLTTMPQVVSGILKGGRSSEGGLFH